MQNVAGFYTNKDVTILNTKEQKQKQQKSNNNNNNNNKSSVDSNMVKIII
jgi:hypothetical protein